MNEVFSFSEDDFPVSPEFRTEHRERVSSGKRRMSEMTVVICGLARDVEHILLQTIARIEHLGEMFADYRVVIYENDSRDRTKLLLEEWALRNPRVEILLRELGDPVNPNARCLKRAERMAKYRNECLESVRSRYSDFTHVIVVDTDLPHGWSNDGVANTFGHDGWDFVGSNGLILRRCGVTLNTLLQYDAWAFRVDEDFTPFTTAQVNYMSWQRGEPFVPVTCCFGGLAVYRMPAFLAGTYSGHDTEHVTHQQVAQAKGFRNVFLNPSQITFYGRHRRRSDLWMIPLISATTRTLETVRLVPVPSAFKGFRTIPMSPEVETESNRFDTKESEMSERSVVPFAPMSEPSNRRRMAVLLTSYNTGAQSGKNMGIAGYSHDIVAKLYLPLLSRWGEVITVANPKRELEQTIQSVRERNLDPVHVSILPLQDVFLAESAPNVVVPAWEFPDVPDHEFDGKPQNNWPATAARCASLFVGGPFTVKALRKAGTTTPIHIVPVPTPNEYFELPDWNSQQRTAIEYSAIELPQDVAPHFIPFGRQRSVNHKKKRWTGLKRIGSSLEEAFRWLNQRFLGPAFYEKSRTFVRGLRAAKDAYKAQMRSKSVKTPYHYSSKFELSGVVYTSIFNPADGRKNWNDLITGFLSALGDREDATLVIKLITSNPKAVQAVLDCYNHLDIPHRCRVVVIHDYLSEAQLVELAQASTFYLQTTKAEGNCLPLMNYLAAGRPGISPCHSAIADYFDDGVGFVIDSHPEPAAWPHDPLLRVRSTWARIVWPSLVDQIRASYNMAKSEPAAYAAMAERGRRKMFEWASEEQVWRRLSAALDASVQAERVNDTQDRENNRRSA